MQVFKQYLTNYLSDNYMKSSILVYTKFSIYYLIFSDSKLPTSHLSPKNLADA